MLLWTILSNHSKAINIMNMDPKLVKWGNLCMLKHFLHLISKLKISKMRSWKSQMRQTIDRMPSVLSQMCEILQDLTWWTSLEAKERNKLSSPKDCSHQEKYKSLRSQPPISGTPRRWVWIVKIMILLRGLITWGRVPDSLRTVQSNQTKLSRWTRTITTHSNRWTQSGLNNLQHLVSLLLTKMALRPNLTLRT